MSALIDAIWISGIKVWQTACIVKTITPGFDRNKNIRLVLHCTLQMQAVLVVCVRFEMGGNELQQFRETIIVNLYISQLSSRMERPEPYFNIQCCYALLILAGNAKLCEEACYWDLHNRTPRSPAVAWRLIPEVPESLLSIRRDLVEVLHVNIVTI